MDSTSVSLLRRLSEPSAESAWQRFVDLYAPLIFHWGKQQGMNSTDASDLVQDVLTVLVTKLPAFQYDPQKRFRGWLRTITINRARDAYRGAVKQPMNFSFESSTPAVGSSQDLFEEEEYQRYVIHRALELMRTEFREEIWTACWKQVVEGQKASNVAKQLNLSLNSVYLAKSRVLNRLREELSGLMD